MNDFTALCSHVVSDISLTSANAVEPSASHSPVNIDRPRRAISTFFVLRVAHQQLVEISEPGAKAGQELCCSRSLSQPSSLRTTAFCKTLWGAWRLLPVIRVGAAEKRQDAFTAFPFHDPCDTPIRLGNLTAIDLLVFGPL